MESNFFIPQKIKVGYQERNDTYTKKLAYVIYYDQRGVLRKEKSWEGWRDEKIEPNDFENIPTSGFVLNKKVGGYRSDWNYRSAHVRIYDPRGFEFEIGIENLLYILENTNSIKGKGLEGDFVYGFDGKDLVLISTLSPDYINLQKLNELRFKKEFIKSKDLIIGATYRHTNNASYVYMGKFNYFEVSTYDWGVKDYGKTYKDPVEHFYFYRADKVYSCFETFKSISSKFIDIIDDKCISDYSDIYEKMSSKENFSPIDPSRTEFVPYSRERVTEMVEKNYYNSFFVKDGNRKYSLTRKGNAYLPNGHPNRGEVGYKFSLYEDGTYSYHSNRNFMCLDWYEKEEFIEILLNKFQIGYVNLYLNNGKFYAKREN